MLILLVRTVWMGVRHSKPADVSTVAGVNAHLDTVECSYGECSGHVHSLYGDVWTVSNPDANWSCMLSRS